MDGMMPYHEQLEIGDKLRTEKPLDLRKESESIDDIIGLVGVVAKDEDRCADLILMTAVYSDMERHFCGDIEGWEKRLMDRIRIYADQYIDQQNALHGHSGKKPLPPDVIFEGEIGF